MDDDEDFIMPTNIPVVGVILLEFTNSLAQKMVRFLCVYINDCFALYPFSSF